MSKENTEKKSPYGKGFVIRMGVLSTILLVLGALFLVDRAIMVPAADAAIAKMENGDYDVKGDHKAQIRELAGSEPTGSENVYIHELEHYEFKRILPFMAPRKVTVQYINNLVVDVFPGGFPEDERHTLNKPVRDPNGPPGVTVGSIGGGGGGRGKPKPPEDDATEDKDDDKEEDSDNSEPENGDDSSDEEESNEKDSEPATSAGG